MSLHRSFARGLLAAAIAIIIFPASAALADWGLPEVFQPVGTSIADGSTFTPANQPLLSNSLQTIGVTAMRVKHPGITGAGQTVVVIDTGIDYRHPALAGRYIGGWDFGDNDANPMDDMIGGEGHGTHVAGIIASTDATYGGVAPGVNIISLKVFPSAGGGATDASVLSALDWVSQHAAQYNITAVNMSLGNGKELTRSTMPANDPYAPKLSALKNAGIFVSAASGNDSYLYGISHPAVSPYVVSVGATWAANDWSGYIWGNDSNDPYTWLYYDPKTNTISFVNAKAMDYGPKKDDIAFFTNRYKTATDGQLDLLAPGAFITSTVPTAFDDDGTVDGFKAMAGTSMASPHVAAASTLIRQALIEKGKLDPDPAKQVDQILAILQQTGVTLGDWWTGNGGNNSNVLFMPADFEPTTQEEFYEHLYVRPGCSDGGATFSRIDIDAAIDMVYAPEPATMAILAVGGLFVLARRRRK